MKPLTISLSRFTAIVIALLFCFYACRKTDRLPQEPETLKQDYRQLKKQFFNVTTADPEVQKVAADLQKRDSLLQFLPDFVKKNGMPKWDKTLYKIKGQSSASGRSMQRTSNASDDQGMFFIPLQSQNSQEVQAYITAYKHGDSTYTYKLFNKDSLKTSNPQSGEGKKALVSALGILAYFEKTINNQQTSQYNLSATEVVEFKNPTVTISDAASTGTGGRSSHASSTNSSQNCNFLLTVTETYTEINVYVNGELVFHYESYSVEVVAVIWGDCGGGGGGGNGGYDPWSYPGSNWYNWGTGYNYDPWWYNINYNGWLYPWWTSFGGGGGGNPYTYPTFSISDFNTDSITNPCLKGILDTIGLAGHQTLLLKLYQTYFGSGNDNIKITYKQNDSLKGNSGNYVAGHTDVNTLPDGTKEVVLTLNPAYMQNATKEFKAAVILHELVHAYLTIRFPNRSEYQQHQDILDGFAGSIASSLGELYPYLPPSDAVSLALQGLDEVYLIPNGSGGYTIDPIQNATAIQKYGQGLGYARSNALDFFNGTKGSPC